MVFAIEPESTPLLNSVTATSLGSLPGPYVVDCVDDLTWIEVKHDPKYKDVVPTRFRYPWKKLLVAHKTCFIKRRCHDCHLAILKFRLPVGHCAG